MTLVSTISYIDRNALALLIPTIRAELGLSAEQYGYVVSAFSVAYMLGNPIWGALLDSIGLRRGMMAAVGLWTVASAGHAAAGGFGSLAVLRAALGFGEGATFPGALRTVWQTLPEAARGRGIALSYSGGSLGAIITPPLITAVVLLTGWRGGFWFTGLVGLAWMVLWWQVSRQPSVRERPPKGAAARVRWRDTRLWGALAAYALGSVPLGFILYNGSLYLTARFGVSQAELGGLLWLPPLGWELGYFFWGWLCDRLGIRRAGLMMAVAAMAGLPLAWASTIESLPALLAQLVFSMFITSGFIIPSLQFATRITPPGATSLVAGLGAGSFSLLTAVLAPWFGQKLDAQDYASAFRVAALFPVIGWVCFWWTTRVTGGHRSGGDRGTPSTGETA